MARRQRNTATGSGPSAEPETSENESEPSVSIEPIEADDVMISGERDALDQLIERGPVALLFERGAEEMKQSILRKLDEMATSTGERWRREFLRELHRIVGALPLPPPEQS